MKTPFSSPVLLVLLATVSFSALAESITTLDGTSYDDAVISQVNPAGIVVSYSDGVVQIPFTNLSDSYRKKYNYDPEKAKTYLENESKAENKWMDESAENAKKERAAQEKAFQNIESDLLRMKQKQDALNQSLPQSSEQDQYSDNDNYSQQYSGDNSYMCYDAPYGNWGWGYYPGNFSYSNPYWYHKFNNARDFGGETGYVNAIHGSSAFGFSSGFHSCGGFRGGGGGGRR